MRKIYLISIHVKVEYDAIVAHVLLVKRRKTVYRLSLFLKTCKLKSSYLPFVSLCEQVILTPRHRLSLESDWESAKYEFYSPFFSFSATLFAHSWHVPNGYWIVLKISYAQHVRIWGCCIITWHSISWARIDLCFQSLSLSSLSSQSHNGENFKVKLRVDRRLSTQF